MAYVDSRMKFVWLAQAGAALAAFWFLAFVFYILISPSSEIVSGTPNRVLIFTLVVGSAIIVLGAVAAWAELFTRSFAYEFGEKEFIVQKGLFMRKRTSIPYDKIKEIRVLRSGRHLLDQAFGLATLRIDSSDKRLQLAIPGVADPDEAIRTILARSQGKKPVEVKPGEKPALPSDKRIDDILAGLQEIKEMLSSKKEEKEKRPSFKEIVGAEEPVLPEARIDDFSRFIEEAEHRKRGKKK